MILNELELQSSTWLKLVDHLTEQLNSLRSQNDGDLDPIATAKLRGRVSAIKTILSLGESHETVQAEAD